MEKSSSENFLIRLDNHPSAESFNQLMNPRCKVFSSRRNYSRNFQGFCGIMMLVGGIKWSILHPWVVVGAHGHQRVGCRSTDCWDRRCNALQ